MIGQDAYMLAITTHQNIRKFRKLHYSLRKQLNENPNIDQLRAIYDEMLPALSDVENFADGRYLGDIVLKWARMSIYDLNEMIGSTKDLMLMADAIFESFERDKSTKTKVEAHHIDVLAAMYRHLQYDLVTNDPIHHHLDMDTANSVEYCIDTFADKSDPGWRERCMLSNETIYNFAHTLLCCSAASIKQLIERIGDKDLVQKLCIITKRCERIRGELNKRMEVVENDND